MKESKRKAVIYCRCSTEEESQKNALKQQVMEARECVSKMHWELVCEYVESKSGTSVSGRSAYLKLHHDLQSDLFEIVVIKSIDRLMRNVKDWYLFLERLIQNGKRLYLYLEGKFYTPEDNLIVGIKAILAEEYSRELSKKINHAHRNRQKKGTRATVNSRTYGYKKMPDKSVIVDEEERPIIEKVYQLASLGYGGDIISNILYEDGVRNRRGGKLSDSSIRRIIRNPLYKGLVIMNRRHYDFELKKTLNTPEEEWIRHEGLVPAIVTEEVWTKANIKMDSHISKRTDTERESSGNPVRFFQNGRRQSQSILAGKLVCGLCGAPYYRTIRHTRTSDKQKIIEWKCHTYLQYGREEPSFRKDSLRSPEGIHNKRGCDNIHLPEDYVMDRLTDFMHDQYQEMQGERASLIEQAMDILKEVLEFDHTEDHQESLMREKEMLWQRKNKLLDKLLEGVISDNDYQKKAIELEEKGRVIEERITELSQILNNRMKTQERLAAIREHISVTGIDKATLEELLFEVDNIYIYPDHLRVVFKAVSMETPGVHIMEEDDGDSTGITIPVTDQGIKGRTQKVQSRIKDQMIQNPRITARKISMVTGLGFSCVQYQIRKLRAEGSVEFHGKGGIGWWEVKD